MGSLERHDGYLHNAETIAKFSPKLNIKLHEWNKRSTTDDDDSNVALTAAAEQEEITPTHPVLYILCYEY